MRLATAAGIAATLLTIACGAEGADADARRIERVVLTERWDMGYGGMMVLEYRPVVLYADGTLTYNRTLAVAAKPSIDGHWRLQGGKVSLMSLDGKPRGQVFVHQAGRPAKPGQKLSGRFSSFSGLGGGGTGTTSVVAWSNYDFAADGTVRFSGGAGASTPKNGSEKASVVTRSSTKNTARYSLDGHTITFTFADGSTQRLLFYFMGSKEDMIVVGSRTLSNKK